MPPPEHDVKARRSFSAPGGCAFCKVDAENEGVNKMDNAYFWNGHERCCRDIDLRDFDWWCDNCKMAIQKKHVDDDCCPECGDVLQDMDEFIGCCNECEGKGGELVQDPEGNWVFRRD